MIDASTRLPPGSAADNELLTAPIETSRTGSTSEYRSVQLLSSNVHPFAIYVEIGLDIVLNNDDDDGDDDNRPVVGSIPLVAEDGLMTSSSSELSYDVDILNLTIK